DPAPSLTLRGPSLGRPWPGQKSRPRTVVLAYAKPEQMAESVDVLDCIAELRLAKEVADFFVDLPMRDQRDWTDDLVHRVAADSKNLALCLLDSGVVNPPLIHPFLVTTVTAVPDQR